MNFFKKYCCKQELKTQCLVLIPLLVTSLLQRAEHLLDNRFMSMLGIQPLSIHALFFNFFLTGQAIGLATATSAFILWKRVEFKNSQGQVMKTHLGLAMAAAGLAILLIFPWITQFIAYFKIDPTFSSVANQYLVIGLFNLILQAVYGALNAMLIASDQRMKSVHYISGLLVAKLMVGIISVKLFWNGHADADSIRTPMLLIGSSTVVLLFVGSLLAYRAMKTKVDGWIRVSLSKIISVWRSEIIFAMIRSIAPIVFSFQLARVVSSERFYVTYQLALQTAYVLVLPLLAGTQIATRDASQAQSHHTDDKILPLSTGIWFRNYLVTSLVPAEIFLLLGAFFPAKLLKLLFGYTVPSDHISFLNLYFVACAVGQIGSLMVIRLRSVKKNHLVTRNAVISEIVVQLGFMQLALFMSVANPTTAGLVTFAYCGSNFILSSFEVRRNSSRSLTHRKGREPINTKRTASA